MNQETQNAKQNEESKRKLPLLLKDPSDFMEGMFLKEPSGFMERMLLRAFRFHGGDALKSYQVSWRGCS